MDSCLCVNLSSQFLPQHNTTNPADDDDGSDGSDLFVLVEDTNTVFEGFRQLMDALMSTYKEPCVSFARALVFPSIGEFLSKPLFGPEIKATAMNLMNSVVKHGGASGSELIPAILPIWMAATQDEDADVRVTAFFGIGLCALSNPGLVIQGLAPIWQSIQTVLGKKAEMILDEEEHCVWDNAVTAAFRLFHSGLMSDPSVYNGLLSLFPIESDLDEAAAVVEMIVAMSDRHRPSTGLRSLAEQQVNLLKDKYEDFQQVWHHFCNSKKQKFFSLRDSLIQIEGRCSQFLSLFT